MGTLIHLQHSDYLSRMGFHCLLDGISLWAYAIKTLSRQLDSQLPLPFTAPRWILALAI